MTPAARVAAAIEILDQVIDGTAAEKALTNWARRSRFAGSSDRLAVRDHVFDALRCKRSFAALGGDASGRGLMLGALQAQDKAPADFFTGLGHAPSVLTDAEANFSPSSDAIAPVDLQDWQWEMLQHTYGARAQDLAKAMCQRADVFLRVNLRKTTVEQAISALALEGVTASADPISPTALRVQDGARRVANTQCYLDGLVELQDGASQAVVDSLPLATASRILDYCAGGGGKALAIAALTEGTVFAHDINVHRMTDLAVRAARAGVDIVQVSPDDVAGAGPFDLVLCDAPCSGSGAWRRSPEGKWALTPERLAELTDVQDEILQKAASLVRENGILAYATCSLFDVENSARIDAFLAANSGWRCNYSRQWSFDDGADGFFVAHLTRAN